MFISWYDIQLCLRNLGQPERSFLRRQNQLVGYLIAVDCQVCGMPERMKEIHMHLNYKPDTVLQSDGQMIRILY
jgi:hypothetical protein